MNLIIGTGIDEIKLGITQKDLIKVLGEPDKIKQIENIDYTRLSYNKLMATFCFDPNEENRLVGIEVSNSELYLRGYKLIGMSRASVLNLFYEYGVTNMYSEEYEHFEALCMEDIGIEIRIEFDSVQEVRIGVCYDENDNIIWP